MQHSHHVVGLIGKKRSGKDTFAEPLLAAGFDRVAFADPLKAAAYALDPLVGPAALPGDLVAAHHRLSTVVDALGWEKAKDLVPEVRRTLQRLGTEAIRALDETFWVRAARESILALDGPVVVTDVRMVNEADLIRELGGTIVRVVRPGQDDGDGHTSESALAHYREDLRVVNDSSIEDLHSIARGVLDDLVHLETAFTGQTH